ncbi:MAG: GNAT family N-acetyltransferase [Pseudomonadota bacterium]
MTIRNLDPLLKPRSVAVIGASLRPGSVGATVWRNLSSGGFEGPLHAVNARPGALGDTPSYTRVEALPEAPDLAVICTPPATVPGLIAALGALGTRAAVVITAGLSAEQRQQMLDAARPHLLRVLGPNCIGLLTPQLGLNASFAHAHGLPGDIAFVSQSGALVTAVLDWANARRIGFSHMVSLGEHADVDFGDLLDWLARDPHTKSILLYIESISSPRKFMSAARAAARVKPVIVVKAGRSSGGIRAAASHTGALAASDSVFDAAIRRAGMLRVDTLADLFTAAQTLARFAGNRSERLTVITNGGGAGVVAADAAGAAGVALTTLEPPLLAQLDAVLPANWSHTNPVDIIGDAPTGRYVAAMRTLLEGSDAALLFLHAPTAIVDSEAIAQACLPLVAEFPGRIMASWLGADTVARARALFIEAGVPDYATPEEAVRAFSLITTYRRNQAQLLEVPRATPDYPPERESARNVVARSLAAGGGWLDAADATELLRAYGVPIVATRHGADVDNAVAAAQAVGYPVALKIQSPDITHKTDVGGVALGLEDAAAVRRAAEAMLASVRQHRPDARLGGFVVQQMARRPDAVELIVGASVDPVFGPILLVGHGGTAVEVLADSAVALPPINEMLARELIARTRVARLLAGWRGRPPARIGAVAQVLVRLSQLLADLPEVAELDVNPLCVDDHGVLALDARVRIDARAGGGAGNFSIRPYPDQLEERVVWQGRPLLLRPIRPEDEPAHRAFIARLAPEDMRLRFFQQRRELSKHELARLTQIDYEREMAFLAVSEGAGGAQETLAVARAVADPDNVEAEFAIVVRSDLQHGGLGQMLLHKLITYCRAHGTQRLIALILRENRPMLALAESCGFSVDTASGDRETVKVVLDLQPPAPHRAT